MAPLEDQLGSQTAYSLLLKLEIPMSRHLIRNGSRQETRLPPLGPSRHRYSGQGEIEKDSTE